MAFSAHATTYTLSLSDVTFDVSSGTITDYLNTFKKDIEIPATINVAGEDVAVTAIGDWAFSCAYN